MSKIKELLDLCASEVSISYNAHKSIYQSTLMYIKELEETWMIAIDPETQGEMVDKDSVVQIQAYPTGATNFYIVVSYDVDIAIEEVIEAIKEYRS